MFKRIFVALFMVSPCLMVSCVGGRKMMLGEEEKIMGVERAVWINDPGSLDREGSKAFVGTSKNAISEGEARTDALKDARKQIIDAMGVYGKRVVKEVISNVSTASDIINPGVVSDDMSKMLSEAEVTTRAKKFHVEKWQKMTDEGIKYYYLVFVQVYFSNVDAQDAVKKSIVRQAKAATEEKDKRNINRALEQMKQLESEQW